MIPLLDQQTSLTGNQRRVIAAAVLGTFTSVNLALVAESMGVVGMRVEQPAEFAATLERAIELKRTVLIDVVTDMDAIAAPRVVA